MTYLEKAKILSESGFYMYGTGNFDLLIEEIAIILEFLDKNKKEELLKETENKNCKNKTKKKENYHLQYPYVDTLMVNLRNCLIYSHFDNHPSNYLVHLGMLEIGLINRVEYLLLKINIFE